MLKFTKKMVLDYINGEDIPEYGIDTLENDVRFMTSVLDISNDKECYSLCSKQVQQDYTFTRFCLDKFKSDETFVTKVADNFLENCTDDVLRLEIIIIVCQLIKNRDSDAALKYNILLFLATEKEEIEIEQIKIATKEDTEPIPDIGQTGFLATFDKYNGSPIIINYFAKKNIAKIICPDDTSIEDFIHSKFSSKEALAKVSIVNYLINYLACYDPMLSSYVSSHIELLNDTLSSIKTAQNKWNYYNNTIERKKMDLLFDYIQRYMETTSLTSPDDETFMLYLAANELGIEDTILDYDMSMSKNDELYRDLHKRIDNFNFRSMSMEERHIYTIIKKMIIKFTAAKTMSELKNCTLETISSPNPRGIVIDITHKLKK